MYRQMILTLVVLVQVGILRAHTVIYSEDFDSDPNFYTDYTPISGEYFTWSSDEGGVYKVRIHEQDGVEKFIFTPLFSESIMNEDFTFSVDLKPVDDIGEWGLSLQIGGTSSYEWRAGRSFSTGHNGTNSRFNTSDGSGNSHNSPSHTYGNWYTITIDYEQRTQTADICIVDRNTQDTLFYVENGDFDPSKFDRFALGNRCLHNDGNWITLYYDNILLTIHEESEQVVYSEDFDSDPNFYTDYTPISGEYFTWSSDEGGVYKVRIHEQDGVEKFIFTPLFSESIMNEDFTFSVDLKPVDDIGEWGLSLQIGGTSSYEWRAGRSFSTGHNGTNSRFNTSDGSGNSHNSPSHTYGNWYTITIDYEQRTQTADICIVDRNTQDTLFYVENGDFDPSKFDRFALGNRCLHNDGNWITLYYDNILLTIP